MKRKMNKSKMNKRKMKRAKLGLKLMIIISILVAVILMIIIRFHYVSLCKNIQHTNGCCPLAYNCQFNTIGEQMINIHGKMNTGDVI